MNPLFKSLFAWSTGQEGGRPLSSLNGKQTQDHVMSDAIAQALRQGDSCVQLMLYSYKNEPIACEVEVRPITSSESYFEEENVLSHLSLRFHPLECIDRGAFIPSTSVEKGGSLERMMGLHSQRSATDVSFCSSGTSISSHNGTSSGSEDGEGRTITSTSTNAKSNEKYNAFRKNSDTHHRASKYTSHNRNKRPHAYSDLSGGEEEEEEELGASWRSNGTMINATNTHQS
jgi:hypothetical protein